MELVDAIANRRAVRDYTAEDVAESQLRSLVDAAVKAPSAMNGQPWAFRIVRDRALMTRISVASKAHMLRTTMAGAVAHHLQEMLSDDAFHIFYHAPALIVIAATEDSHWAVVDCALAAENLMLAACDAGLGSCWIGFAEAWLGTADGKSAIDLPASYHPVAPIIIGHPASAAIPAVARREPEIGWIG